MVKKLDIVGNRYGMLEVLSFAGKDKHCKTVWECKCDCGNTIRAVGGNLQKGNSTSCGCARQKSVVKHNGSRNRSYYSWRGMIRRCNNPIDKAYFKYGAVGIKVCEEWHNYVNFVADMGEPADGQSLDRIDPYGNYEKNNCRWANAQVQSRNIRVHPNNKSGHNGVHQTKTGKWMAQITVNGKTVHSKRLTTKEEAVAARKELEKIHWGST